MKVLKLVLALLLTVPLIVAMKFQQDKLDAENRLPSVKSKDKYPRHIRLEDELLEISGIVSFNGGYFAINDGGPDNNLYQLDSLGKVQRKISIDAPNNDWEALSIDKSKIYIGDIGNNFGQREFLNIIAIDLKQLISDSVPKERLEIHSFACPFGDLASDKDKHDLDCEAMLVRKLEIHLFSKNRLSDEVKHAVLDLKTNTVKIVESVKIKGQVTDATLDQNGDLLLIGYKPPTYGSFMVRFIETKNGLFFQGKKTRKKLGGLSVYGQSEAVCLNQKGELIIGSEGNKRLGRKARLHVLKL